MPDAPDLSSKPATAHTAAANAAVADALPFHDRRDFADAERGRIAEPSEAQVRSAMGFPVWDLDSFAFLDGDAPPEVNPSLWRQAQLNAFAGLFEVAPGFLQVRGLDLSNVTFVEGRDGWIVIDPLTSAETAAAALALLHAHRPTRPVTAVIYTHSHVDHFAGVRGVITDDDVTSGRVRVIAPDGFLAEAISENVIAGPAMLRRASYMYGALLQRGPHGHVDAGLGKAVPVLASQGLIAPTETITATGTELEVDGVRIVFQLTPGTEAPAEMNFHFPDSRVLCMAENCTATLHNLYTPRGAQVRDALAWSKYIQEALDLFGPHSDLVFASHHWPRWGAEQVATYLSGQRDLYRFVHDQTMRLANSGSTMVEVAEALALPDSLGHTFAHRDYYGTVNHNAKAVYQRYLGWFDANPAHLHPLPPVEAATRYVEWMGGAEAVLDRARGAFTEGDYRWVAEVVHHVVFADPDNLDARALQADALEQLGYQAESGPWRDFYLTGAQELRFGPPALPGNAAPGGPDVMRAMTTEMLLDYLGVRLDGAAADAAGSLTFALDVDGERWTFGISHGALWASVAPQAGAVAATLAMTHDEFTRWCVDPSSMAVEVDGDADAVATFVSCLTTPTPWFPIVTP